MSGLPLRLPPALGSASPCPIVTALRVVASSSTTLDSSPARVKFLVYNHSTQRSKIYGSSSGMSISAFFFPVWRNLAPEYWRHFAYDVYRDTKGDLYLFSQNNSSKGMPPKLLHIMGQSCLAGSFCNEALRVNLQRHLSKLPTGYWFHCSAS